MKILIQILLCIVLLVAGFGGFKLLTGNKPDGAAPQAASSKPGDAQSDTASASTKGADTTGPTKALPAPVAVVAISKASRSPAIALFGTVESPRESALSAALSADVIKVNVLEGRSVEAGAVLIELDPADIRLNIAAREAEIAEIAASLQAEQTRHQANLRSLESERELLRLSQEKLKRYTQLAEREIGTRAAADEAAREVQQQQLSITQRQNAINEHVSNVGSLDARRSRLDAQLEKDRRDLERTQIRAPVSGVVTEVRTSPGNRVRSGEILLTLYDREFVEVRAQIPNRYLPVIEQALETGSIIKASSEFEGRSMTLELDRFAAKTRSGTGGVDALLRIVAGQQPQLGRTLDLELELPAIENSFEIPATAFRDEREVIVVRDSKIEFLPVTRVGRSAGSGNWLVTSPDLTENDIVVVSPLPGVRAGLEVSVSGKGQ